MKKIKFNGQLLYPPDPWVIREKEYTLRNNLLNETIFSLSNGYLGMRGSFEEGIDRNGCRTNSGTYINGFYESVPIPHAERGHGYALNTQTMLNVTNSRIIRLYVEDEPFLMTAGEIIHYERYLDMRQGYAGRAVTWRSPGGREVEIKIDRLISFREKHLACFSYKVKSLNFEGRLRLVSELNGAVDNHIHEEEDPRFSPSLGGLGLSVEKTEAWPGGALIIQKTQRSNLQIACAMENIISGTGKSKMSSHSYCDELKAGNDFCFQVQPGNEITMEKYAAYYTSLDNKAEDLEHLVRNLTSNAADRGYIFYFNSQQEIFKDFWNEAGIDVEGDTSVEQGLHFNLFHLIQASGNGSCSGIGAKGLTSEGYDGHYFWDSEIYLLPFYAAVMPKVALKLLNYRYSILDHARSRARELSHPCGALYPWRTIAGEEGSSYYPAGTAQYHINAAIAYAICRYTEMTGDYTFMLEKGAEMIFETARLFADLGCYVPRRENKYCFHEVTGPDEYTALVNNNCYTNLMAAWHLGYAAEIAEQLRENFSEVYSDLAERIGLGEDEPLCWQRAADNMYIPYDDILQIHPQDDSFLDKEIWDFAATPAEKYPLLLHYHPLVIYRYQVCKQPDIILAELLLGDRFTRAQKLRDYHYYEPITTHDSSLSPSIFAIVAAELNLVEEALNYFRVTVRLDLDNLFGDTHFGVHMANMAGSWLVLAWGFGGMRTFKGKLSFEPFLPAGWISYSFQVVYHSALLRVKVSKNSIIYTMLDGKELKFLHVDQEVLLTEGEEFIISGEIRQRSM